MTRQVVRGTADVDGATLAYELAGSGPLVALVHGFSLDMRSWDPQFAALAERFTVLRYDLRGFGRSSLPGGAPYSHVADLAGLLRTLGLGPTHLVGLSLGANTALGCTLAHPDLVRSLVLVSSGLPGHPWQEERPPDAAMAYAQRHGAAAAKRFWLDHALFASAKDYPQAWGELVGIVGDYSGWHWENRNPMLPFTTDAARLRQVSAPTLVVSGGRDVAGYREIAEVLAGGIPGARKLVLPEAGHMLTLEVPDRFNAALVGFLDGTDEAKE